jgi:hypothetical protein
VRQRRLAIASGPPHYILEPPTRLLGYVASRGVVVWNALLDMPRSGLPRVSHEAAAARVL